MSTFLKLKAKLAALDRDIEAAREAERADALATCRELVALFDFDAMELGLIRTQVIRAHRDGPRTFPLRTRRGPQPPKYRNPATGETWTGLGRVPRWMAGEDRDDFLIVEPQQAKAA
jgi:DNA-binding protein H-NS